MKNDLLKQTVITTALRNRMLLGAGIGLFVILFFVLGVNEPRPEWGRFWMIRPLVIVPLAGAMAGLFSHLIHHVGDQDGWRKVWCYILSFIVHFIAIWMGVVLGLNGTMWH